jgi:uncharacterized protein (DUF1697 family)
MAGLRDVCADLGWADVRTWVQSGNVVFAAAGSAATAEQVLERAIADHFGIDIPVIVRRGADWPALAAGNPFPEAARTEPNLVMVALSKVRPQDDAVDRLRERAQGDERLERVGDALWIHYSAGVAKSKLSPGMLDRAVGSPVTTRNWRTVLKLQEMLEEGGREG